jgi:hypothetical protein
MNDTVTMNDLEASGFSLRALDGTGGGQYAVIAAGPITKQPKTTAFRVVMVDWRDRLGVHTQYFPAFPSDDGSHLEGGRYYGPSQATDAVADFGERLAASAQGISSCLRGW